MSDLSRAGRDQYVKQRRLNDLNQAGGLLIAAEFSPDVSPTVFESITSGVVKATAKILTARDMPFTPAKLTIENWVRRVPNSSSIEDRPSLSLGEVAERASRIRISGDTEPQDRVDMLLMGRQQRTTDLSDGIAGLIQAASIEDEVDLFFAPKEVYAYYREQRESNNCFVKLRAKRVLGTVAICAYANQVDFERILQPYEV